MFAEAGAWFWTMVVASIAIIIGDHNGTLEPALNKFEESIGIRTEVVTDTIDTTPPYYIPPIEEKKDAEKDDKKNN